MKPEECVKQIISMKRKLSELNKGVSRPHSEKTKKRLSEVAKERKLGGYVKGSGRGKSGWYKGFWCDSSYELAYVIYNLEHNIEFKRNNNKFPYEYDGKKYNYTPDFILSDGMYIEIKGYSTDQTKAKLKYFNKPIQVLFEKDLDYVFKYVKARYGKNFISLYEK